MGATGSWAMEGSMTEFRTLRAGIFLPPFHPNDEDPLLCMERDFELMQWLDKLDYAEAWIGGHQSRRYSVYGQPERVNHPTPAPTSPTPHGPRATSLPYPP